jgi:hypothetical protein
MNLASPRQIAKKTLQNLNSGISPRLAAFKEVVHQVASKLRTKFPPWFRREILASIPFTSQYKLRINAQLISRTRDGVRSFRKLKTLDAQFKRQCNITVIRIEEQLAFDSLNSSDVFVFSKDFRAFTLPLLSFIAIFVVQRLTDLEFSLFELIRLTSMAVMNSFASVVIAALLARFIQALTSRLPHALKYFFIIIWDVLIIDYALTIVMNYNSGHHGRYDFEDAQILSMVLILYTCLAGQTLFYLVRAVIDLYRVTIPHGKFARNHLDVLIYQQSKTLLALSENDRAKWNSFEQKRVIMHKLEDIAKLLTRHLARNLRSGDASTDIWFEGEARRIAQAFRNQKQQILAPKQDTQEQFTLRMSSNLKCILTGSLGELPSADIPKIAARNWAHSLFHFARIVLSALVPLAVFLLIQSTSLAFEKPVSDYILLGVLIWIAISIIAVTDPDLTQKDSVLSMILRSIPFFSPKKDTK